jgi:MFS family permease
VTVTGALMLAVYAIVNGNQTGWTSGQTLGLLAGAVALLALFLVVESRVSAPLMPLRILRMHNVATANVVGVLWAAAMFAFFFLSALYLQLVLGYGAGIAFNAVLLAAMSDVEPQEAGLASGLVNTAFMMGGALGLAVLVSIAASRTDSLSASGHGQLASLVGGYHVAFVVGAVCAVLAAAIGTALLRVRMHPVAEGEAAIGEPAEAWS